MGQFSRLGIDAPYGYGIHQDNKDSTKYIVDMGQSGLGLPDRDYYLNADDAKFQGYRAEYLKHVEKMLTMAGDTDAAASAKAIMSLETAVAKAQWSKVELRDPIMAYNKIELSKLNALTPEHDLLAYLQAAGVAEKITYVIVSQPSYFTALAKVMQDTPLATWKSYFKWRALSANAAILQAPFFDANADDAVNYGGIGAVIGHEISHGFDDQGAQYDEKGNLRDWWTKDDHKKFAKKTAALVKQYNSYSPIPGYFVNGELTLGENIADNSGLAIAYKAYQLSLGGKPSSKLDGLTGEQRLYMGFGQVWQSKMREASTLVQIKTDPHSPAEFRGNGTITNQTNFYKAFSVKKGDKMYLAPEKRVTIW